MILGREDIVVDVLSWRGESRKGRFRVEREIKKADGRK